jgi:muramoyltetrapeptide carboxypeptidase LdcA involved in peptidoglycan recycling
MLRPGDTIAAVTLSWGGPGTFPHRYEAGVRQLEAAFGVKIRPTPHALREPDWIARNPRARAEDLMAAFADPAVQGIIVTIGGDDSIRTLPFLDLGVIRANPKVFLGFSDTTVTTSPATRRGSAAFTGHRLWRALARMAACCRRSSAACVRRSSAPRPWGS